MRVIHILNTLRPSGAETMLKVASAHFKTLGIKGTIVSTGSEIGPYAGTLAASGYEIVHRPFSKSPFYFFDLARWLRRGPWDVVHLHTEQANFYYGLAALGAGKRVIRTIHSNFIFDGFLKLRRRWQRKYLEKFGLVHVAIGASVLQNERSRFHTKPVLIENWYDENAFYCPSTEERRNARAYFGIPEGRRTLVTVGNCAAVKNHGSLLEALSKLPRGERPLYLHAGKEDEHATERAMCKTLGLTEDLDIRFLGAVDNIARLLHAADYFCMPSTKEGFSIAAAEALAVGLPMLLTDAAGLIDLKNLFPDIIYCSPDSSSLGSGLQRIVSRNHTETARLEQAKLAARLYSSARGAHEYATLYKHTSNVISFGQEA